MQPLVDPQPYIEAIEVGGAHPLDAVTEAARTAEELKRAGDTVVDHFVAAARKQNMSWTQIATSLGVTRQSAHKRFGSAPDPKRSPMGSDGIREKPAPFCGTRLRDDGAIEVLLEAQATWYRLISADGHSAEDLAASARQAYGNRWLKRLSEDLDCVYEVLGDSLGPTVEAVLEDASGRRHTKTVESTTAKRKAAWRLNAS